LQDAKKALPLNIIHLGLNTGTLFRFFSRGGQHFDRLPRGGQNMKKTKCCVQKHKKSYFSKPGGGGNAFPA